MAKILRYAARSDVGKVRSKNDDSAYAGHYLAVVADGMGGHAGGNVASASTVLDLIHLDDQANDGDAGTALADEIQTANSLLSELVRASPQLAGMGTTVTALLLSGDTLYLAHIGDSRAYRLKNNAFEQISIDHTFVQRLIDEGRLRPEDAETHPHKNVLMRVLGDVDASPELDESAYDAESGERWILCSDGLTAVVEPRIIESVLRDTADLQDCVDQLVDLTLEGGSPDNVTVVVVEVVDKTDDEVNTTALTVLNGGAGTADPGRDASTRNDIDPSSAEAAAAAAEHLNAEELREELRDRPHVLVGAAATVASTGEIPTVIKRTAERRAATLLTHKSAPAAEETDEDLEEAPPRRRWAYVLAAAILALIVAGGLWLGYGWTQTRYYVAEHEGNVAIFNGVSQDIGPISLSHLETETDIEVDDLPQYAQQRLARTVPANDLDHAFQIVRALQFAPPTEPERCASPSPSSPASSDPTADSRPSSAPASAEPGAADSTARASANAGPSDPPECGGQP